MEKDSSGEYVKEGNIFSPLKSKTGEKFVRGRTLEDGAVGDEELEDEYKRTGIMRVEPRPKAAQKLNMQLVG